MSLLADSIPVEVVVRGRRCVAVGACAAVAAKVERLLRAGARVEVYATGELDEAIRARAASRDVAVHARACAEGDLEGAAVVFVSPEEAEIGAKLAAAAVASGALVCTLDRPDASTFWNPASADVSGVRVTVATGGAAPGVARRIREDLEALLADPRFAAMMTALEALRGSLPPGERSRILRERVAGFRLTGRLEIPEWVEGRSDGAG